MKEKDLVYTEIKHEQWCKETCSNVYAPYSKEFDTVIVGELIVGPPKYGVVIGEFTLYPGHKIVLTKYDDHGYYREDAR